MAAKVYANGMEVSGKASNHKVIASMPDVCLSPPAPPAGPIPIPYPNFAQASDTTNGSKTVKAGGKEISLKGKSKYKKSKGDEAATRSFGMGLISHSISGAVKHKAGSFNVKIEGSQVVRTMDLTTGNHMNPGDGCAAPDAAGVQPGVGDPPDCEALHAKNEDKRSEANHQERPSTFAHAVVDQGSAGFEVMWSSSRALDAKYSNGRAQGKEDKSSADSNLCDEADFKYETAEISPPCTHAESRIIEDLFSRPGFPAAPTTVTLSINWNRSKFPAGDWRNKKVNQDYYLSDDPCPHCHKLLCAAQACGIDIRICDQQDGKPKTIEEKTGTDC